MAKQSSSSLSSPHYLPAHITCIMYPGNSCQGHGYVTKGSTGQYWVLGQQTVTTADRETYTARHRGLVDSYIHVQRSKNGLI